MSFLFSKPQSLLDAGLDGKAVHVVAGAIGDVVPLHSQEADVDVLQRLVPGSSHVRRSRRVRRAVDEEIGLTVRSVLDRLLVGVDVVPVLEDPLLEFVWVVLVVDLAEPAHTRPNRLR